MRGVCERGVTLVQLLVVVAILIVLSALTLAGLSAVRRASCRVITMQRMEHLGVAVDLYIGEWKRLGDDVTKRYGEDFRRDPWAYLGKRMKSAGRIPYVDLPLASLVAATGPGACRPAATSFEATHIVDAFGRSPVNVLSWAIVNSSDPSPAPPFAYTRTIDLRSSCGTAGDPGDDLVYHWSAEDPQWRFVAATVPWDDEPGQHNAPLP